MATLETALYTRLADQLSCRVAHRKVKPSTELPYVIFTRIGTNHESYMNDDDDSEEARFQIDIYAATSAAVKVLALAVKTAIKRQRGTWGGRVVTDVFFMGEFDGPDTREGMERVIQEYRVVSDG